MSHLKTNYENELRPFASHDFSKGPGTIREIESYNLEVIREAAAEVDAGNRDATSVARLAIAGGFYLVGGIESKPVHRPVGRRQHRYRDPATGQHKYFLKRGEQGLRVGACVEQALAQAFWGSFNDRAERARRCKPFVGEQDCYIGYGVSRSKTEAAPYYLHGRLFSAGPPPDKSEGAVLFATYARPTPENCHWVIPRFSGDSQNNPETGEYNISLLSQEEAHIKLHARPQLIRAAINPRNPLRGKIDLLSMFECGAYGIPRGAKEPTRIKHEIGQWLIYHAVETKASITVIGNLDMPPDRLPTHYGSPIL